MQPALLKIILATLFSVILWVYVTFSNTHTTTVKVPIEFTNIKEGNSLLSQTDSEIGLTLNGQGWSLAQIIFGADNAFRISTNENIGTQEVIVRDAINENAWLSSSIQVLMISPLEIIYTVEELHYKIVQIVADVTIEISEGSGLVSKVKLTTDSVKISGPISLVKNIETVYTEKYDFKNIDESISKELKLKEIAHINFENNLTKIEFDVQRIVDKTFTNIPISIVNIPNLRELELFPPNIDVTLRGGLENLGIKDANELIATVDFNDAFRDTLGFIKPTITVPKFTSLTRINPDRIKYIIKQH